MSRITRAAALLLLSTSLVAPAARGTQFTFTRIADTATPVPGGSGTFSLFADARALDGGSAAFYAFDSGSGSGIYIFRNGTLDVLVDESTRIPGSPQTFQAFFDVAMQNGLVVFTGGGAAPPFDAPTPGPPPSGDHRVVAPAEGLRRVAGDDAEPGPGNCQFVAHEGIFAMSAAGGRIVPVATSLDAPFDCVHGIDLDAVQALFAGGRHPVDLFHNHSEAIASATAPGALHLEVSLLAPVPGGGGRTFVGFDENIVLSGDGFAFSEIIENTFGAVAGIYADRGDGQGLQLVADAATPVPGGSGTFLNFAGMDADAGLVSFMGRDAGNAGGLFAEAVGGGLRVVADRSTPVPGKGVNFLGFSNPVARGAGNTAFSGFWPGGRGLCAEIGGALEVVLESGDVLDGRVVDSAYTGVQQLADGWMLVKVIFSDLSTVGLYLVEMTP